jgi:hypothetical protein
VQSGDVTEITFCQLDRALAPASLPTPETAAPPSEPGQGPVVPPGEGCPATPGPEETLRLLGSADWIVFAFADLRPAAVRDLTGHYMPAVNGLAQPTGARTAVLSFGPPYYIDATNFAHLDVYVASFTKIPSAIEAALDVLMGETGADGAAPVTIRDADYDLARQLEPDPAVPLPIARVTATEGDAADDTLPARVRVAVGPVLDRNGNPVPDDTEVALTTIPIDALPSGAVSARTIAGSASAELVLPRGGQVQVMAASGDAVSQKPLSLSLPVPTPTPVPPTQVPHPTVPPTTDGGVSLPNESSVPSASDLLLAMSAIVLVAGAGTATSGRRRRSPERVLRTGLLVAAGGLTGYVVAGAAASLGASAVAPSAAPATAILVASSLAGACLGLAADLWSDRRKYGAPGA